MYTILVTEDNSLRTTIKERIMQRSKLVDNLKFLVPKMYKDRDMSGFTVTLEYILPVSKTYHTEILTLSNELYKDHLQYFVPFDTDLTSEAGEVELQLTFSFVDLGDEGNSIQYVRKTEPAKILIVPIAAWSDIIPDDALTAIDQRIMKTDAQIKELKELGNNINENKADNISLENGSLQLLANGNKIGNPVNIGDLTDEIIEGNPDGTVKIVHF